MNRLFVRWLPTIAVLAMVGTFLFGLSHGCAPNDGCSSDVDCKGERICENKVCVSPNITKEQSPEQTAETKEEPPPVVPDEPVTLPDDAGSEPMAPDMVSEPAKPDLPSEPTNEPSVPDTPVDTTPEVAPDQEPCQKDGEQRSCYEGPAGTNGVGVCKAGMQTCTAGYWSACIGEQLPSTELCNGKDDNCDGKVDENIPCLPSCMHISSTTVDFGPNLALGCVPTKRIVKIINNCSLPVVFKEAGLTSTTDPEFTLNTALPTPYGLNVRTALDIEFSFRATKAASSKGLFRVVLRDSGAYAEVELKGQGIMSPSPASETFTVPNPAKVDVLFVVSNVSTMKSHQTKLVQSLPLYLARAAEHKADYQIGVITTDENDNGYLEGVFKIVTPQTTDIETTLARNIEVGTAMNVVARPLETSKLALSSPVINNQNKGFLRADAILSLVFVTNRADQSKGMAASYIQFFQSLKTNRNLLRASVLGPSAINNPGCNQLEACRLLYVMKVLGGHSWALRSGTTLLTIQRFMEELADITMGQHTIFPLAGKPDPASLTVKVNGTTVAQSATDGWQYEASRNAIRFKGTARPAAGTSVEVTYKPTCQ